VTEPDHVRPFVLTVDEPVVERHGSVDLYLPPSAPAPAVVLVHGGPVPAALRPTPRDWPVYRGYASSLAARGLVGVMLDHRVTDPASWHVGAADVAATVELARADPRVDADRVALWFFSGGGLLLADWLRDPPSWLRCVAATYPVLAPLPGWPDDRRLHATESVAGAGALPIVLTRVGLEHPAVAPGQEEFVAAAAACGARLDIIDVPDGHHGFDYLDHTDQSRAAVDRALTMVHAHLTGPGAAA
jgi:dienelactone hydrolase